jgi:hypothetical protein
VDESADVIAAAREDSNQPIRPASILGLNGKAKLAASCWGSAAGFECTSIQKSTMFRKDTSRSKRLLTSDATDHAHPLGFSSFSVLLLGNSDGVLSLKQG